MRIILGADGDGKPLLDAIAAHLAAKPGLAISDFSRSDDHADIAGRAASAIVSGDQDLGILVCSTGNGVCISANKVPGIRAAVTHDTYSAVHAARSLDAQIIGLGARIVGPELARTIVETWLAATLDPERPVGEDAGRRFDRSRGNATDLAASQLALQEQRECREAIRRNTIEAYEGFLAKYANSHSGWRAMALDALRQFQPGEIGRNDMNANLAAQAVLEEQRECREAIGQNTIEALEAFLAKYPDGKSGLRGDALDALRRFQPG